MEIILAINSEASFTDGETAYEGFEITTDKQVIRVGIEDGQQCCEAYGCLTTEDDLSQFIGSDLIGVTTTDTSLNTKELDLKLDKILGDYRNENSMFVNIETTNGTFQIVVYNDHNGYYGHDTIIISEQLTEKNDL
jgi:hypothetical protein